MSWTQTDNFAVSIERDYTINLNLLTLDDDAVNEESQELLLLLKGQVLQPLAHPLAEGLQPLHRIGSLGPLAPDALQQRRCRLITGVLGHQLALEGALEDSLAQPLRPLEVGLHYGLRRLDDGHVALHLGNDALLLS